MVLTNEELLAVEREYCKRHLAHFVKEAWHVLEPGQPYVHGWHIDAIAEHLEAVTYGDITRLLINVPPGTMKSLMTNVFWPAWEWGPLGLSHLRFIGAAHEEGLATRDTLKMRRLIQSEWFQERWPLTLAGDQNQKTYFENERTGFRQSCAVKSMTGRRGDRVGLDDPHSVEGALSEKERETAIRVFQETLPSRLNNPDSSAIVVIMQRLHENDVAGFILSGDYGYEHLCLPMEYETWELVDGKRKPKEKKPTSIGFVDPRTEDGELLFPARFPRDVVERDKKIMGEHATAGQFQQHPAPRTAGFFDVEKITTVDHAPKMRPGVIRYWDKAGTDGGGAYTAGVKMGVGADGYYYVLDVKRAQLSAVKREPLIRATAEADGIDTTVWLEQEPGSGGKESAESTKVKTLAGFVAKSETPTGEKEVRATPFSIQVEAGNVRLVKGAWNADYLEELRKYPAGKYKDQVDASAGAFNKLAKPGALGLLLPQR